MAQIPLWVCLLSLPCSSAIRQIPAPDLPKSARSSTYIFIGALEGSGHHLFGDIFHECASHKSCDVREEAFYRTLIKATVAGEFQSAEHAWRFFPDQDHLTSGRIPLNCMYLGGMMSYPFADKKTLLGPPDYVIPRADVYSDIAQRNGDRFKMLVVLRDPSECACSVKRRWGQYWPEVIRTDEDYVQSMRALRDQVASLRSEQYRCVHFYDLGLLLKSMDTFLDLKNYSFAKQLQEDFDVDKVSCKFDASIKMPKSSELFREMESLCGSSSVARTRRGIKATTDWLLDNSMSAAPSSPDPNE